MLDKFKAVWVSHSSISDFLACPRAYYLNNVYKDPSTGNKITIMSPPLALGQAVHEVVESLSVLPTEKRFKTPLREKLDLAWQKVKGRKGGFDNEEQEKRYRQEGNEMLRRIEAKPGPIKRLAVKIQSDLPHYWLSEEDEIILCGKIDWLEYLPDSDGVVIVDFKTGKSEEREDSLQLPIYYLLATHCQKRPVMGAAYWYLRNDDGYKPVSLPEETKANEAVFEVAKRIKLARKLGKFACAYGGCRTCEPYERVLAGEAQLVGTNDFRQDVYVLSQKKREESVIL